MTDTLPEAATALLAFWFDELSPAQWFVHDRAVDTALASRFASLVDDAVAGELDGWPATPPGALALILALDQLPRNLYRGDARAFAGDARARQVARQAIARGFDHRVDRQRRLFFYLPFEHSEALADQEWAVALIEVLGDERYTDYARRHRDVIERFGRFPHRNRILRRRSTAAEKAYLAAPGSGF